jgi:hypothetical protein
MPGWFPSIGGQTVDIIIEDLTRTSKAKIKCPEARLDDICRLLFDLENALRLRLRHVMDVDHNKCNAFFELIKDDKVAGENFRIFLQQAEAKANAVQHADSFRPSAGEGLTVIGRLMRMVGKSSADELSKRAKAFSAALDLDASCLKHSHESLLTVIFRPTIRVIDDQVRFGRNVLLTIFAASQMVTAAAHADDYGMYPVLYLQGTSYDLRVSLQSIANVLQAAAQRP